MQRDDGTLHPPANIGTNARGGEVPSAPRLQRAFRAPSAEGLLTISPSGIPSGIYIFAPLVIHMVVPYLASSRACAYCSLAPHHA